MIDHTNVIGLLKKMPGFFAAYHKTSFVCNRKAKSGKTQTVLVEIHDAGEGTEYRYTCIATVEAENGVKVKDGKSASGNSDSSIEGAIAIVHWGDLDK